MAQVTKTLKLPFLRLNQAKAREFARLENLNTEVANHVLTLSKKERRGLTSKSFDHIEIGSGWINQTIRNANAKTKVKNFKSLPLEINNQGWTLHKIGETFSVSFNIIRGVKKRIPLEVHEASHRAILEALLENKATKGSLKLVQSRKNIWYACISVSMDVPDAVDTGRWIGVDRGQNIPVVAASSEGPVRFWKVPQIRHVRRVFAARRKKLQKLGKHRAVKKLENRERRIITHINHCISKQLVRWAVETKSGIRLEDLSGIRKNAKQRKVTKSDAGQNRDYWPFYQLEQFIKYKAQAAGVVVESVPPYYTSKTCHCCGSLNERKKHAYTCNRCGYKAHADANAAMNIRDWYKLCCPVILEASQDGLNDTAPKTVRKPSLKRVGKQEGQPSPKEKSLGNPRPLGRGGCQRDAIQRGSLVQGQNRRSHLQVRY